MKTKKYKFTAENAVHTSKVFVWVVLSSIVAGVISFIADVDFPKEYAVFVPIINTILVAIKEYLDEKR